LDDYPRQLLVPNRRSKFLRFFVVLLPEFQVSFNDVQETLGCGESNIAQLFTCIALRFKRLKDWPGRLGIPQHEINISKVIDDHRILMEPVVARLPTCVSVPVC